MNKIVPLHQTAGAFELKEGAGGITGICSFGNFVEMYKIDKTFCIQSPRDVDPEQTNPDALWVTTPVNDVGSKNPIIARVILQNQEILKSAWFKHEINKEEVMSLLHACKEKLLICDRIAKKLAKEIDNVILKIEAQGVRREKNAQGLNPFPHISNLTEDCGTFLAEVKRAIKSICELPAVFFSIKNIDNNFDSLADRLTTHLKSDAPLLTFINSNAIY